MRPYRPYRNNYRRFESINKSKLEPILNDLKDIHDQMKSEGCPIDIEYDGAYADIFIAANFAKKVKAFFSWRTDEPFATITWNTYGNASNAGHNMSVWDSHSDKSLEEVIDTDKIVNFLLDLYPKK